MTRSVLMKKPGVTEEKYKEIAKLLAKKKFSQARRTAEKLSGHDPQFLCEVAMIFKNMGQLISAKHLLKLARDHHPKNA